MQSCACALGKYGIRCNALLPGTIRTQLNEEDMKDPVKRPRQQRIATNTILSERTRTRLHETQNPGLGGGVMLSGVIWRVGFRWADWVNRGIWLGQLFSWPVRN
jgi:NAD(P)-dependent dehydrogenase (short-subunit alcohol dehydrogenase family)